jgi:hypothetical protein
MRLSSHRENEVVLQLSGFRYLTEPMIEDFLFAHRAGMSVFDIAAEGGWRDLKMVQRYTKNRPFEELQRLPTPLSILLRNRAS